MISCCIGACCTKGAPSSAGQPATGVVLGVVATNQGAVESASPVQGTVQTNNPPVAVAVAVSQSSGAMEQWLSNAGVSGNALPKALNLCNDNDIESESDLREIFDAGNLEKIGFTVATYTKIQKQFAANQPNVERKLSIDSAATGGEMANPMGRNEEGQVV